MWFLNWDVIYLKSTPSKTRFFRFIFTTESYFHFLARIVFIAKWTIFVFMKYFTIFHELLLNQLVNLTSVSITLFVKCFSVIFKNITHALHKQNHPCKAGWNVYMGKNVPPKRNPGLMNVESLLGGRIYFHINRFWFFFRILL